MTSLAVVFVFVGGSCFGGLALYTLWRLAMTTPEHAMDILEGICKVGGVGHWVRVKGIAEDKTFVLVCPACGHEERGGRGITAPPEKS